MSTLSIRRERIVYGSGEYAHDTVIFGLFRDGRFWTAGVNEARVELTAYLGSDLASGILDSVAFDDGAYDIDPNVATNLNTARSSR